MKILFLTTQLPYPPYSGGVLKSWNLVKHWSKKYELNLFTLLKDEDKIQENEFLKKLNLKDYYSVDLDIARSPINLLISYFRSKSLNMYRNWSCALMKKVKEKSAQFDLIFIDHYEMGQYVPDDFKGKVILHTHNAEFMMWSRYAKLETNWLKRWVINIESNRIKKAELNLIGQSDLVFAAPNDIDCFCSAGADRTKFTETIHLGDDHLLDLKDTVYDDTDKTLLYVGTLSWEANIDGLLWFINEVWPQIQKTDGEIKLKIIGKNPDQRLVDAVKSEINIVLLGFVEDLEPHFKKSRVFIAPLRFGSGIKVKVLNAMYRGIPSVTTSIGVEGLHVINEEHILISDKPDEWVQHISNLLSEKKFWTKINQNSRNLVKNRYTWKQLLNDHDHRLEQLFS